MSIPVLVLLFIGSAVVTWFAGIYLSKATDALDNRLNLGEALGGMILLALAGTLPELAITVSAAASGHIGLAAGNLVGGIAVQTCVLVICDAFTNPSDNPLSYLVGSLIPVLEGVLVVAITSIMLLGALLKSSVAIGPVSPASIGIVLVWIAGIYILNKVRSEARWSCAMPGSQAGRESAREEHPTRKAPFGGQSTVVVVLIFLAASAVTLVAGVGLEVAGNGLASKAGISGVLFGATVIALSTALPEISTGIAAVRIGDNQLAMGDIFGGNAFQLCLFLIADIIAGKPTMPAIGIANAWLGSLGILLTAIYVAAVVIRPTRTYMRLGIDSIAVIVVYVIGVVGLGYLSG